MESSPAVTKSSGSNNGGTPNFFDASKATERFSIGFVIDNASMLISEGSYF